VNISGLFIRRPVLTTLSMLSVMLAGVIAYRLLPVSDLPNVDFPTIEVSASLPGANADTMASAVATTLEKEFSTIAGIDSMSSASTQGNTRITIQFSLDRDIDAAAQDVQTAISRTVRRLPSDMPNPPSFRKVNPADSPILYLALTSDTLPMSDLDDLGQTMMAQQISMVKGVAQVQVFGSQKYAVRIELSPDALAARGIGIDEVADAISSANVNMPLGSFSGPRKAGTLDSNGQLLRAEDYMPLVVSYRGGRPVRLRDVGVASDSVENDKSIAWLCNRQSQRTAIILAIQRQPGTNTVEVAQAVKDLLPTFRQKLPAAVSLEVMRDSSRIIEESARDVQFTLLLTLGLVVLVIFLFLRNFSATVIPSLVLPMSVVGTFGVMYAMGYSLDNLSLMALTLSVGFVVDDAIVMLENIVRHMEMGKTRLQAALEGSREIGFTIVSMTLSLAAVFIPFLLMGGIVGRLFREFSVTIGAAVLVSGFVSLTLTPLLSSRWLKDPRRVHHGLAYRVTEAGFQAMLHAYDWLLRGALRWRLAMMGLVLAALAGLVMLFYRVPLGFIPSEDRDQISVGIEAAQDASFQNVLAHQQELIDIFRQDGDIEKFMSRTSGSGGGMFLVLRPRSQRTASVEQIIQRLRPKVAAVPGVRVSLSNPPAINLGGRQSRALYQYTLQSGDTDDLYRYAGELEAAFRKMPELTDVSSDLQMKNPTVRLVFDRDKGATHGVTQRQFEQALYNAYGTRQVSTILAPDNQYAVIMELAAEHQTDPSSLSKLYIRSSQNKLVPLTAAASPREDVGPLAINHSGQLPSVTISFNLAPGVALGQARDAINAVGDATRPDGVTASFQGTAQAFEASTTSLLWLFPLAVLVIYIVLGILYESFWHPLTILSAIPFSTVGAMLTLYVFGIDMSIYAMVGIIMLVGLVKKNGIMMVDFALQAQRDEGKSPLEAIHQACIVRFRPIMMTTMAALMGALPIALGLGAGGEARQPLGLTVVGGLLFSQTLTLFVTPVFYYYVERIRRLGRRDGAAPSLPAPAGEHLSPAAANDNQRLTIGD
jgi:HAE1 family hydrophobic/amphiphilic exporter-1